MGGAGRWSRSPQTRRSFVRLIKAGVPLPTVQRMVGHQSIETMLTYYNAVTDDDLRDAVAKARVAT